MDSWSDAQWDFWYESTPSEQHVMRIAGMWSVDPTSLDDDEIVGAGIHGAIAA
jgi:hypothetical protein